MDPRLYPSGSTPFGPSRTGTESAGANLVPTYDGNQLSAVPVTAVREKIQTLTASGAVDEDTTILVLNNASAAIAATIAAPTPGRCLKIIQVDAGTQGHTVTLGTGTWNGTNNIATLNNAGEALLVVGVSATRFGVIVNTGSVGFSGT